MKVLNYMKIKNEIKQTTHLSYCRKYCIVFAPKSEYIRKVIYNICAELRVKILEAEACT